MHYTCDTCGKNSEAVRAGRWLFYCSDNPICTRREKRKIYDNEIVPALEDGTMPDDEALEIMI